MARRQLHRETRADLLWVAVGFVALQVGLTVASGSWLPELRDPRYGYKAARLRARMAAHPISAVMLGSSRTAFGLRGTMLEDRLGRDLGRPVVAFNFGTYGAGPVTELVTLRRLLAEGVRPDLLLVEVTPVTLAGQPGVPGELAAFSPARLWLNEVPVLEQYGAAGGAVREAWWRANAVPWYGYRFAVVSRVVPRFLPARLQENFGSGTDPAGWAPLPVARPTPEGYRHALEKTHESYREAFTGFRLGGPSAKALADLLALCRAEGLAAALVLMPESSDFRGWYPPTARAEIATFLAKLSRDYAAPVIDAREWVADDGFSDGHHLLPDGAAAFTDRLGPAVLRLLAPAAAGRQPAAGSLPIVLSPRLPPGDDRP